MTFEEALAEQMDSLYATAYRLVGVRDEAEDLVQETALRAYRSFAELRSHDKFRPWLFTILCNLARNWRRDTSRRVPFSDVDLDTLLEDPLLAEPAERSAEQRLLDQCLSDDVASALDTLPPQLLRVLWLVDVQDLRLRDVSGMLAIPEGTVASRLHRARRALRDQLRARIDERRREKER